MALAFQKGQLLSPQRLRRDDSANTHTRKQMEFVLFPIADDSK